MKDTDFLLLQTLIETASVTGSEQFLADVVRTHLGEYADEISTDCMGSVHARINGSSDGPVFMLAAHMDEIGLMVNYISPEGFLSVSAVGGVDSAILPSMRVDVHASGSNKPLRGVIGKKPIHLIEAEERKKVSPLSDLVVDVGLSYKKVKKLVKVGDVISFAAGCERLGKNMAVSRAFDDKIGVFIALQVAEELSRIRPSATFIVACTVQEEIGTRGAITSSFSISPDVALAFDVTHATDYPGISPSRYGKIVCGKGPVIARGPNINPEVYRRLMDAAASENIACQIEAEPHVTGTDARSIQVSRGGIPTGLVSLPLRYMHTSSEVINLGDVRDTVKLIVRFACDLDSSACFIPGISEGIARKSTSEDEGLCRDGASTQPAE